MSNICTPEEIERKKRLAQEKLSLKRKSNGKTTVWTNANVPPSEDPAIIRPAKSKYFCTENWGSSSPAKSRFGNSPQNKRQSTYNVIEQSAEITASCVLMNKNHFQVKLSKYFPIAVAIFKTIPSSLYNCATHNWQFAVTDYDLLLSKLQPLRYQLVIQKLPVWLHYLKNYTNEIQGYYNYDIIDEKLRETLMPFQEESLYFAIKRNGRCLIADEMGLGKTLQALAIAAYYKEDWPLLIVSPASTIGSWQKTIYKYLPSVHIMDTQVINNKHDFISNPIILITSYDMMTRKLGDLVAAKCGACILDESHTLRNFKTKCFQGAYTLSKIAKRLVLLSGTPALSKPNELYTQLQLIDDQFFGSFTAYSTRYCDGRKTKFGWSSLGESNLEELNVILEERFMIRRTKESLNSLGLPEKIQEMIVLDMSLLNANNKEKIIYGQLAETNFKQVIKNEKQLLPFFHSTAKIKIPLVRHYIAELLKDVNQKFIVFAHHLNVLDAIEDILTQTKVKYVRIDGRSTNREYLVNEFQTAESVKCALLSITATNAGITLTAATLIVFTELYWTPSILAQAEARAHRIGQTQKVTVRYLIAPKTIDDYIWPILQNKQTTLKKMQLTSDSFDNIKTIECTSFKTTPSSPPNTSLITNYFSPPQKNGSDLCQETVDHFDDDDVDDFLRNFCTQQILNNPNNSKSANIFDDGMDEFLMAIPID